MIHGISRLEPTSSYSWREVATGCPFEFPEAKLHPKPQKYSGNSKITDNEKPFFVITVRHYDGQKDLYAEAHLDTDLNRVDCLKICILKQNTLYNL